MHYHDPVNSIREKGGREGEGRGGEGRGGEGGREL